MNQFGDLTAFRGYFNLSTQHGNCYDPPEREMRGIGMRTSTLICTLLLLATSSVLLAVGTEEEQFRGHVEEANRAEMDVSFDEYRDILSKLGSSNRRSRIDEPDDRIASSLHRFAPNTPGNVLLWLGILVLIIVIVFFIRQIRRNLITVSRDAADTSLKDAVVTERAALSQSEAAAASHNFRDALRYLYLSAILHLQEQGILTYDKSLTNLEYLHTLQMRVELQDALRPVIQVFDDVWYGYKPCNAGTIENYRELLQKVYLTSG